MVQVRVEDSYGCHSAIGGLFLGHMPQAMAGERRLGSGLLPTGGLLIWFLGSEQHPEGSWSLDQITLGSGSGLNAS